MVWNVLKSIIKKSRAGLRAHNIKQSYCKRRYRERCVSRYLSAFAQKKKSFFCTQNKTNLFWS